MPAPTGTAAMPSHRPRASRQALAPLTPAPTPNFACNSLATLSNFESTSLKFRGFLDIANWSDDRIACEIGGELQCAEPNASTHSPDRTQ